MINYVEGDLFEFIKDKNNLVIAHVANCFGKMGSGFVIPLSLNFPKAKEEYVKLGVWKLGETQFVEVKENVVVANMIAQTLGGKRPLYYNYLVKCMEQVADYCVKNKFEVVSPLFGSQLAKGDWNFIEKLIEDCWLKKDILVTICYLKGQIPTDWILPE